MNSRGPIVALISAALFALSPVLTKAVLGDVQPLLAAGLLYLGSGVGLLIWMAFKGGFHFRNVLTLSSRNRWALAGAVMAGGVLAPTLLLLGVKYSHAYEVSLLLNLEAVATTVLAFFLFHEHAGTRVWTAQALILAGAVLVSLHQISGVSFSLPALFVVGACVLWGLDNNLTRAVEDVPPATVAAVKGVSAGLFNVILAVSLGFGFPTLPVSGALLGIGLVSYGVSLVLFIQALRLLGSARTGAYFATGPFIGMSLSVLLLGERPALHQWGAGALMGLGIWLLLRESHGHAHRHEPLSHSHWHTHDEHHQHAHDEEATAEAHDHPHEHGVLEHSHPHVPDVHHRHWH